MAKKPFNIEISAGESKDIAAGLEAAAKAAAQLGAALAPPAKQLEGLRQGFGQLATAVQNAFAPLANAVLPAINAVINALSIVFNLLASVGAVLFGGAGEQLAQMADGGEEAAKGQLKLASSAKKAGAAAKGALAAFDKLDVLQRSGGSGGSSGGASGGVGSAQQPAKELPGWLAKAKALLAELNRLFAPSIQAWGDAFTALRPVVEKAMADIRAAALDLWQNGLAPLGGYILTEFIPGVVNAFSQTFAPIFRDIATVAVQEFAQDFAFAAGAVKAAIHDIILPALRFLKQVALDIFAGISAAWAAYGQAILTKWVEMKEGIRAVLTQLYETIILPITQALGQTLANLWNEHLKPLWDNVALMFLALGETLLAFWNGVVQPLVSWFISTFGPVITAVVSGVGQVFGQIFGAIAGVISGAVSAFRGLLTFLTGVFTGDWQRAWQGISDYFGGIWSAMGSLVKGVANAIIACVNGMISGVTAGINAVIGALNGLSFEVPGWVPGLGGKRVGFSIPRVGGYQIPYLATGAVIPPRAEFLAVLGDQSNGRNLEAPEGLIRQIVREESGGQQITIRFTGSMAQLVRALRPEIEKEDRRVGARLVEGGAL